MITPILLHGDPDVIKEEKDTPERGATTCTATPPQSNEAVTSSRVGPQSSGSTYTKEQNKKISNAKSSVVQWETGKVHPVPAPREHKLNTYRVRSLSPTPVIMSDGPSPLFDPPHTKDKKETPSIANCWRLNEKNG